MHLVESFDRVETIVVDGQTLPARCVVEDDEGIRWFVMPHQPEIHAETWVRAASAGTAVLVMVGEHGYSALTTEAFMEERSDYGRAYLVPDAWARFDQSPIGRYADVVQATRRSVNPLRPEEPASLSSGNGAESAGFVHLHTHYEYSLLDGMSKVSEVIDVAVAQGATAVGSADHGNVFVHPYLQKACDAAGIKPVFGIEAYLVDDRFKRLVDFRLPDGVDEKSDEGIALRQAYVAGLRDYMHLCLYAIDDVGLSNLWALSTEGFRDGLYGKNPRIDWDTLSRFSEGIVATTACLRGPLCHHALLEGNHALAEERLARLMHIYPDRLYVEIHANQLEEQKRVNRDLVDMARRYDLPLLAAVDSHYAVPEHKEAHRVWLSIQTGRDIGDDSTLFAGNQDYHLLSPDEVRESLAYLGEDVVAESMANTVRIAEMSTAKIESKSEPPIFSRVGGRDKDVERLLEQCLANWHKTLGKRHNQDDYEARFEYEVGLLIDKQFPGYFLMTAEQTNWARSQNILVGPGRGSGGGSLVAYLMGITDIDPVEAELLIDRFITPGRTALPDFDIDYPQSKKQVMQEHVRNVYGADKVAVVGSIGRLKNKGIIKALGTALGSTLPQNWFVEQKEIAAIIEDAEADTAGLGLSWEALWDKSGESLQPYRDRYPYLFEMADILVNRVRAYGQHAAGMVMATDASLVGRLPMRRNDEEGGHLITQFDKDILEEMGFVKFDLLTLRNLDTVQGAVDMVEERTGRRIDLYAWREEYGDPQVMQEITDAHTLGVFQIETNLGRAYAKRLRPENLADLADLVTIVRPGPRNSGLTDTYIRRRDGQEEPTYADPRMRDFLDRTYGCLLYQEDIMQACMVLAGYDGNEADGVRKILGKKKVELVAAAGQEFVARAAANGMDQGAAAALWAQMAEFAKYSFNRAHAYAYAVLAYWTAWLKVHYPVEFLTAALSGVDKDRIPDFVKEARRMGFQVLPPDINESGVGFRPGLLQVRYGLDSVKGIAGAAVTIQERQPFSSFEDFMERVVEPKDTKVDRGQVLTLARIGAFDSLVPNRRGLERVLLAEKSGEATQCVNKTQPEQGGKVFVWISTDPKTQEQSEIRLPCEYDWENEPAPINPRTQKAMKRKAPPKKCTKACRHYTPRPPMTPEDVEPYTDADIRDIEQEILGLHLTSTPFDMLADEDREQIAEQIEMATDARVTEGLFLLAGTLTKVRPHRDKSGREMGFIAIETEGPTFDAVAFNESWTKYRESLKPGAFVAAEVQKRGDRFSLYSVMPLT